MTRYTRKELNSEIEAINHSLKSAGYFLTAQHYRGKNTLDLFQGSPENPRFVQTLTEGTPFECMEAAHSFQLPNTSSGMANQRSPFGPFS